MIQANIIDIHCHTAGIGAGGSGCFVSQAMRRSWKYNMFLRAFGVTDGELDLEGDGVIIRKLSESLAASRHVKAAVILAMDGVIGKDGDLDRSITEIYIPNDFVAAETSRCPNLLFGASINPYRQDALQRLSKAASDGAVLVKWLPSIQHIDPSDECLIPFYQRLNELGLPLLTHTGSEESFTWARNELADPEKLRLPLSLGVTVIAAHAASNGKNAGQRNFARFIALCHEYENLFADISALTQVNRIGHLGRVLKQKHLHGRLLYGTDMPILKTGITSPFFHAHCLSPLKLKRIMAEKNPWDRDVELKLALGVDSAILRKSAELLAAKSRSIETDETDYGEQK